MPVESRCSLHTLQIPNDLHIIVSGKHKNRKNQNFKNKKLKRKENVWNIWVHQLQSL